MRIHLVMGVSLLLLGAFGAVLAVRAEAPAEPPTGPFGLSRVTTADGKPADIDDFFLNEDCGLCHRRQQEEMQGSLHSIAHLEPFYRAFAELARKEAGEEVYTYCSGCHSAAGVVAGLIPGKHDPELPDQAKAGVTCDVCHQITKLTGTTGPWGEPGNASFVLDPGRVKYGGLEEITRNPAHKGGKREFYASSEFCASCHTIIHPVNGLRIEHTYDEWKKSIYAEKGIQCQDCHMRTVEDARKVAETMTPVPRRGTWSAKGPERDIDPHFFVGANSNVAKLGGGEAHAAQARMRLKSAARLEIRSAKAADGSLEFEVAVLNVGAGHRLPTSLTELREMWVDLVVTGPGGKVLHRSGDLDERGDIREGAIRFGAIAENAKGEKTYRPWEIVRFRWKRLVPPKGETVDPVTVALPAGLSGEVVVEAKLLYRSAPPAVVEEILKDEAFEVEVVEMAAARTTVVVK